MKTLRLFFSALVALLLATGFTSCSNDDDNNSGDGDKEQSANVCFDIVVSIGEHGGMNQGEGTVVRRVSSLNADQPLIDFNGKGLVLTGEYTMEAIVKGKYYYQIPESADRFVKFEITSDDVPPTVVASRMFGQNTYKQRSYTHTWLDNGKTLLIMSANGDRTQVLWTKLNADDLSIIAEGTLEGVVPSEAASYGLTTSGILAHRESDGKLFYFYQEKQSARVTIPYFYTAVVDASTMKVESISQTQLAEEMAGSAYGELLQNIVMFDEADNLYIACLSASDVAGDDGILLRINSGETDFDPSYNGYLNPDGKLLTIQYLGDGKAFIYSRNDRVPNPDKPNKFLTGVSDYIHYYSILDIRTGQRTRLQYAGEDLPYCAGRFAQRSVVFDGKVYFGVTAKEYANPCIYIYDITTGEVSKGAEISEGFYFDMVRLIVS